jgi:transcriptional regulator with XRE-family HTH domain
MQLRLCIISAVDFSKRVGLLVRRLRLERGLSQQDLANLMNYERSRIGRLELGQTAITVDILLTIANALEVDIHSLLPVQVKVKTETVATEQFQCQPKMTDSMPNLSDPAALPCHLVNS